MDRIGKIFNKLKKISIIICIQGYIWKMDLMGHWPIKSKKHGPGYGGPGRGFSQSEMKTTDNEKGGNIKSAGGLGAAPGPQVGSMPRSPGGGPWGRSPRKNMGFQLFQDLFSIEN